MIVMHLVIIYSMYKWRSVARRTLAKTAAWVFNQSGSENTGMQAIFARLGIWDFLLVLVGAAVSGALSPDRESVLILLLMVATCIGARKSVFKVVLPVAAVLLLAAQYSNGDTKTLGTIFSGAFPLSVMILGFYIAQHGAFGTFRQRERIEPWAAK